MKATGIVRRIDDLGRVVIPKEIRRTLRIREGDPMEIFTDREGEVILKKYSPLWELSSFASQFAESISQTLDCLVCICDLDQIIAAAGSGKKEFLDQPITGQMEKRMMERKELLVESQDKKFTSLIPNQDAGYIQEVICPVLTAGDVIGAVVILSKDKKRKFGEGELKTGASAATFLGKQMEQ